MGQDGVRDLACSVADSCPENSLSRCWAVVSCSFSGSCQRRNIIGTQWGAWQEPQDANQFALSRWRTDTDLLGNSQSGTPLPVGQVVAYRSCQLINENATVLAQLEKVAVVDLFAD